MKKPKTFIAGEISVADLANARHGCAWDGCEASTPFKGLDLPQGWRWLAVWTGPQLGPFAKGNHVDRDAVLCPLHWALLDSQLKDIGQRLDKTEGSA